MTRFFLPIMLGSLLQQLYSMVDAVVLGRLVGKTALAAVGGPGPGPGHENAQRRHDRADHDGEQERRVDRLPHHITLVVCGPAGAAMATSLSQLICAGLVIWVLLRIPGDCRLHVSELRFDSVLLRRMTAIGLPAGLATIMYSVANVIIQKAINLLGTDTAAAWSIYWKLDGFYWPVSNAIGITVMTFAGQNYGARQLDRITSVIRTGMWMHVGFSALFSALLFLTRGLTVRFFTDDTNVMAEGSRIITMLAFFYPTFCCVEVLSSAMRGCGRSVMPTVLTLFGTCLLRLALLFFVTFPHLNNWTIALCYPATWLTTSVLFVIYYKCFRWMPEIKQA